MMNYVTTEQFINTYLEMAPDLKIGKFNIIKSMELQLDGLHCDGFMLLQCEMLDSSRLGDVWILGYGPHNTYKVVPEYPISVTGVPSGISVVVMVVKAEELRNFLVEYHK